MDDLKGLIGRILAEATELPDEQKSKLIADAVVASGSSQIVGWTQPSQISIIADSDNGSSAEFWSKRDTSEVQALFDLPDMPDDVPLYNSPQFSARIKPLEWVSHDDGKEVTFVADTIIGRFLIWEGRNGYVMRAPPGYLREDVAATFDEAVENAYKTYCAIIRTALLP